MPAVHRQNAVEQIVTWCVERWKSRFVNFEFPWLWAVRPDWDWAKRPRGENALELKVEVIEKSATFQELLQLRQAPTGELWVHYFWGDGKEGAAKASFDGADWSNPDALIHAIWDSSQFLVAHIALLEEGEKRKITVFRTKNEWGMHATLKMMIRLPISAPLSS